VATGSVQTILVCQEANSATVANSAAAKSLCPNTSTSNVYPTPMQAYVLDVSQQDSTAPDAAVVAQVWSLAFGGVLLCFFIASGIGAVLKMIREG
jgi:hypothetical protein